ncbi:MAG: hypothetical protein AAB853_00680 [Patescibacteria group bacterium]
MVSKTLTLWPNGVVTLPKEWRERHGMKHFLAKETKEGYLVIMPMMDPPMTDVEFWEDERGNCGLHFPHGIEAKELGRLMDKAIKKIQGEKGYRKIKERSEKEFARIKKRKKRS